MLNTYWLSAPVLDTRMAIGAEKRRGFFPQEINNPDYWIWIIG